MKCAEFLHGFRFEHVRIGTLECLYHFLERLSEFTRWIQGIVPSLGNEVIDLHRVVLVSVDEGQMNRDGVGWTAAFYEVIPDNEKVAEPSHSFIFIGCMQIGKRLDEQIVCVALLSYKAIAKQDPVSASEVPLIQLPAARFVKDVVLLVAGLTQLLRQ